MPITRAMEEQLKMILAAIADMKNSQEEMRKGQEELKADMKKGQEELKADMQKGQEELKESQEEMKKGQEEMKADMQKGQEELKESQEEMKKGQEEMKEELKVDITSVKEMVEAKLEAVETRLNTMENKYEKIEEKFENVGEQIEKIEEKFHNVGVKIKEVEERVREDIQEKIKERVEERVREEIQEKIKERVREEIQEKIKEKFEEKMEEKFGEVGEKIRKMEEEFEKFEEISEIKRRLAIDNNSNEDKKYVSASPRPLVKLSTYDGKTSWKVYKTQFDIVSEANGWDAEAKAFQLAASLRGDAADILQTVTEGGRRDFDELSSALEMRFGESCAKEYSRLQLKSRLQKPGETLQELATDVDRLAHLAYSDCPIDVRESLSLQNFIDGVRDPEIQKALRLADLKDLKSALVYAMKVEAAQLATRRERHSVRLASVEQSDSTYTQLLSKIEALERKIDGRKSSSERRPPNKCWKCGGEGHLRRNCKAHQHGERDAPRNEEEN